MSAGSALRIAALLLAGGASPAGVSATAPPATDHSATAASSTPAGPATAAGATRAPTTPAQWRSYDVLVSLTDLPRTYSCDELWYRFHDLLGQLGARADMTVTPYHCGHLGGGPAPSPQVQLRFQLPRLLSGDATRYAELEVMPRTVRLAPGSPASFTAADCELVSQMLQSFFTLLPVQVTRSSLSCQAPQRAQPKGAHGAAFDVTFTVSVPAPATGADDLAAGAPRR